MLKRFGLAAVAALVLGVGTANAATITIGTCYTGACGDVTGSVLVDISDDAGANPGDGDVKFVVTNNTNGFIDEIGVFYSGGLPSNTQIEAFQALVGEVSVTPTLSFAQTQNDNSGQSLNVGFDYANSNAGGQGTQRFNAGEQVQFFLDSDTAAILAAQFSTGKAFVHLQEVGTGRGSVKLTPEIPSVPEPTSLLLMGSGLVMAASRLRRRS